jgi:hypothetical protein
MRVGPGLAGIGLDRVGLTMKDVRSGSLFGSDRVGFHVI